MREQTTRLLIEKKEDKTKEFAQLIVKMANQENIKIRELESACEMAILYCREAFVPTL